MTLYIVRETSSDIVVRYDNVITFHKNEHGEIAFWQRAPPTDKPKFTTMNKVIKVESN